MRTPLLALLALGLVTAPFPRAIAQTPAPVILQAATPAPAPAAAAAPAAPAADALANSLQVLQEMRTNNAETIQKQEAALATLDELQKAAEEIKIYSKRG